MKADKATKKFAGDARRALSTTGHSVKTLAAALGRHRNSVSLAINRGLPFVPRPTGRSLIT